ncbi:MAG: hypothetical protein IT324_34175 [Anaerolineae bacterium]|nr:hypothetical protein [Anaerolineae bacterium]
MADVLIRDEQLARRLFNLAAKEDRSVEAVLTELIDLYETRPQENPLLKMAVAADALGLTADRDDVSANFDTLLRETWDTALKHETNDDDPSERTDR